MEIKTLGLGFLIAAVAVVAGAFGGNLFSEPVQVQKVVEKVIEERLGASPGPVRTESCETRNGVEQCFVAMSLLAGTTTPCSLRSPRHATSTLLRSATRFDTGSSSDLVITTAKASTYNATTTNLATTSPTLSANTRGAFVVNNDNPGSVVDHKFVFAPGDYLNVGVRQTGAGGQFVVGLAPTGKCNATFEII